VDTDDENPEENASAEESGEGNTEAGKSLKEKWEEVRSLYDKGKTEEARLLAAQVATDERNFAATSVSDGLYVYDPEEMVYRKEGEQALEELLLQRLGPHHSRREVREIKAKIEALAHTKAFGAVRAVPLANGDLATGSLRIAEPNPGRPFLARSWAQWDADASAPACQAFLRRAVPSRRDRRILQDYAGYSLLRWARLHQRALIVTGPKGSGTGRFLHALSQILAWVANVPPSRLAQSGPAPERLRGPWANICSGVDVEALTRIPQCRFFRFTPSCFSSFSRKMPRPSPGSAVTGRLSRERQSWNLFRPPTSRQGMYLQGKLPA